MQGLRIGPRASMTRVTVFPKSVLFLVCSPEADLYQGLLVVLPADEIVATSFEKGWFSKKWDLRECSAKKRPEPIAATRTVPPQGATTHYPRKGAVLEFERVSSIKKVVQVGCFEEGNFGEKGFSFIGLRPLKKNMVAASTSFFAGS